LSGVHLAIAYANVMNPIQIANPVAAREMFTCDSVHSAFSRRRLVEEPPNPHNYDDVDLPEVFKLAETGKRFLLFEESFVSFRGGPLDNPLICFGTKKFFKKLCRATRVHMDGTFKVCPVPYAQLFTICSFQHDDEVGYEDSLNNRLIPRMYCLLSGKSQPVYEKLFQLIKDKAAQWNYDMEWVGAMIDFEHSVINARTEMFPGIDITGCQFHFAQSIFRRVNINMKVSYTFVVKYPYVHAINYQTLLLLRLHIMNMKTV
jgi:hypothetical protein